MLDTQLGRRNLSPIQRIAVAEKYRPIYEKRAKENQGSRTDLKNNNILKNSSKSDDEFHSINVRATLAKTAGVSEDTYQEVLSGEEYQCCYKELII